MNNFCDNETIRSTEVRSKKKSIQRHSRLVRKEKTIKKFRRRRSGGVKGRFVYNNNFLCMLKRSFGDNVDVVQLESIRSIAHELPVEFAMEKPTDTIKYASLQYVSEE